MRLSGLHLLLTYQCLYECDHCFVWGSPKQSGVMTLENLQEIFRQAAELGTVEWFYFEGGEPFLYYPVLLWGVNEARKCGYQVGLVSNAYWAKELPDAQLWLQALADKIADLSISSDLFHSDEKLSRQSQIASAAAQRWQIPTGVISVIAPEERERSCVVGQLPAGEASVMHRGRAAVKLAEQAPQFPFQSFTACPFEELRQPDRVHLDPLGYAHLCQGISLGNLFTQTLKEIVSHYHPDEHPIVGPLLHGGPVELTETYHVPHRQTYADACHLCYETRLALRPRFPEILAPEQMYGLPE